MAETKYIVFVLGQQKYGMRLSNVNGIESMYNVVPIPAGTKFIKGIIHLRDLVIPIYDLKSRFGIADESEMGSSQLLVTETHEISIGFEVDDVIGIVTVPDEDVKKVPKVVKNAETGYLENIIKVDLGDAEEIILCISVDNIMSDSEFDDVSDYLLENQ